MLNEIGKAIWDSKYAAYPGETYEQGCKRVVSITDSFFTQSEQATLFEYLYNQKFLPGGRIWFGSGKNKPQYANCALFDVLDSKESWGNTLRDVSIALMSGNGIGIEVSKVRGKGSKINGSGGTASGTLSYVSMINEVARHIMQGNIHRSACHSAVHWLHKDVLDWLNAKQWDENYTRLKEISYHYPAPFDTFNLSIRYDYEFLEAYHNHNDINHTYARNLWNAHTRVMFEYADPSIQFDWDDQILRNA